MIYDRGTDLGSIVQDRHQATREICSRPNAGFFVEPLPRFLWTERGIRARASHSGDVLE